MWLRWWVITRAGLVQSWSNGWLRRTLLFAWGPALLFAAAFFVYEQVPYFRPMVETFTDWVSGEEASDEAASPRVDLALQRLGLSPDDLLSEEEIQQAAIEKHRRTWDWLFATMFSYSQFGFLIAIVGLTAPPLISSDLRTRAFLIYFARPITKTEYLFGKAFVLWFFLVLAVSLPALVVYAAAIMLTPDFEMARLTYDIPLRMLGGSVVMLLPTTLLALAFSSLSTEQRTPTFMWYGLWAIGGVAWLAVYTQQRFSGEGPMNPHWAMLSLFQTIARVQHWVFGLETSFLAVTPELVLLAVISAASVGVLYYRISAPLNA